MERERAGARPAAPRPLDRAGAERYAAWFRALGDPTRVQMLSVLAHGGGSLPAGEIAAATGVSQPTVSQHLKVLADVGFVLGERRGTAHCYRINQACVAAFPSAADLVVGATPPPATPGPATLASAGPGGAGSGSPPGSRPHGRGPEGGTGSGQPGGFGVRDMRPADAAAVLAIYQAGLDSGQASFETAAPSWEDFDRAKLPAHRHVAVAPDDRLLGWVAASPVSGRCVYAGVVEHSVYVAPAARGRGVGAALLHALIHSTEAAGIWTIQSGIFPENTASLRLHEQAGFRAVGIRRRIGRHHGRWRDVVLIERRSEVAGPECRR